MARMINNLLHTEVSLLSPCETSEGSSPPIAERTRASGFGNARAIKGASGLERRYEPNEPKEVIMVSKMRAGMGGKSDPTRMFCGLDCQTPGGKTRVQP